MTEQQLIDQILNARTPRAYALIDTYLKLNPKAITLNVSLALEAYETYRVTMPKKQA